MRPAWPRIAGHVVLFYCLGRSTAHARSILRTVAASRGQLPDLRRSSLNSIWTPSPDASVADVAGSLLEAMPVGHARESGQWKCLRDLPFSPSADPEQMSGPDAAYRCTGTTASSWK